MSPILIIIFIIENSVAIGLINGGGKFSNAARIENKYLSNKSYFSLTTFSPYDKLSWEILLILGLSINGWLINLQRALLLIDLFYINNKVFRFSET